LARWLIGEGYGGLIGLVISLITGNIALAVAGPVAGALAVTVTRPVAGVWTLAAAAAGVWTLVGTLTAAGAGTLAWSLALTWSLTAAGAVAVAGALETIANNKKTSSEELIDEHIDWLMSLFQKFSLLIKNRDYAKTSASSYSSKQSWDIQLVVSFANELAEVFPEEWDEWQHWISDMIEDWTKMQSNGMNHRLVSLITFYRLTRFAFHIGIDKIFILATRKAKR
jgi:hypothetical protein